MKNFFVVCACLVAVNSASPNADAVTINVNIFNPNHTTQTGFVGPAGGAGETWNQSSTGSAAVLLDSTGDLTSVGYTSNLGGPDSWGSPGLAVLRDGLRNFDTGPNNSQQLVINGLIEGDLYDVWLASGNTDPNQQSSGEWWTPNATTTVGNQLVENINDVNGTTWEQGNNFVLFENVVVNGSGQLVFDGHSTTGFRLPLNGVQLVSVAVPEPGTLVLLSTGLLGVLVVVARRRRVRS